jgi:6-pyruvoyltetrahydropterin/6-carboxytetrahydropterin synthase
MLFCSNGQVKETPMYFSTKTYGHETGLSCCWRNHRSRSHCSFLHGYAIALKLTFCAERLDEQGFVVDFGGLKTLKEKLVAAFDHRTLIAADDPLLPSFRWLEGEGALKLNVVERVGCESIAEYVYWLTSTWMIDAGLTPRVRLVRVEVAEHGANGAAYEPVAMASLPLVMMEREAAVEVAH